MKKQIVKVSVDEENELYSVTTSDGMVYEGKEALRDIQNTWKFTYDNGMIEDKIWHDKGSAERKRAARRQRFLANL